MMYPHNIFLISPQKTYVVGTHSNELHNMCSCGEIRKISGPSCSKLMTLLVNDSLNLHRVIR